MLRLVKRTGGLLLATAMLAGLPALAHAEGTIEVELTESPPSVNASSGSTAAGATTFAVQNVGAISHELVVIRTELAADALPLSGDTVDLAQLDVVADSPEFTAGQGGTLDADLTQGRYVLICNVPGHYGLGMRTALDVTSAAAAGDATPAPAAAGSAGLVSGGSDSTASLGMGVLAVALLGVAGLFLRRRVRGS